MTVREGLSRQSGSAGNVTNIHRFSVDGSDRAINVAGRSDDLEGRTVNVTEPEWLAYVVEYNVHVVYRGMILSDHSIAVDTHVYDTTKQYKSPH